MRAATSQELGALLGACFLLDASLHATAMRVRVTACITAAANGHSLWTGTYQVPRAAWAQQQGQTCQGIVTAAYPQSIAAIQAGLPPDCPPERLDPWMLTQQAFCLHDW